MSGLVRLFPFVTVRWTLGEAMLRGPVATSGSGRGARRRAERHARRTQIIDSERVATYHRAPMSAALPESVDAWRMVASRRRYEGELPLGSLPRLRDSLASDEGTVRYRLEFGRDEMNVAYLKLDAETELPLLCQRSLEVFRFPVVIDQRLGLIAREQDESALSMGYEPLLIESGELNLADVIEDELILSVPVVPVAPGSEDRAEYSTDPEAGAGDEEKPSPFAALAQLKKN